jgi:hypothetical protein
MYFLRVHFLLLKLYWVPEGYDIIHPHNKDVPFALAFLVRIFHQPLCFGLTRFHEVVWIDSISESARRRLTKEARALMQKKQFK